MADKRMGALRLLLVIDAAALLLLGLAFVLAPQLTAGAFGFKGLSSEFAYLIGLWGCALATLSAGYAAAAFNPLRHTLWIQVGIARGALECLWGLCGLLQGTVTWHQAGFGTVLSGLVALAYIVLYPRPHN